MHGLILYYKCLGLQISKVRVTIKYIVCHCSINTFKNSKVGSILSVLIGQSIFKKTVSRNISNYPYLNITNLYPV